MSLHETLSAFANAEGGTVILGVDEAKGFEPVGLVDPGRVLDQFATLCQAMDPPLTAEVDVVELGGAHILIAEIPATPRDRRPCHMSDKPPWDSSFVRVADGDRKLSTYEVQLLLENRGIVRHDAALVEDARAEDLDTATIGEFIARVREQRSVLTRRSDDEVLRLFNIIRDTEKGPRPTLAGLLTFGLFPQQFVPQLDVTVVVFPTPDAGAVGPRGERFLDNRSLDGPIPVVVRDTIAMLKRHMKRRNIITGIVRVDEWEYPDEVLREAVVNALVHRDYSHAALGAQVQVELYPDRLLIRNPGGLYGPLAVDELGLGTIPASSRNTVLLKLLEDTPLEPGRTVCENRGTGIARIRASLTEAGMEPPTFDDRIATFTVTFPNHTLLDEDTRAWLAGLDVANLNRAQFTALALARRGEKITNTAYRRATGVADSRAATAQLQELRQRGLLVQEGNRGQATYRISPVAAQGSTVAGDEESSPIGMVYSALTFAPLTKREIVERTGLSDRQVGAALQRLRLSGRAALVGHARSRHARWRRTEDYGEGHVAR
jgi:ATP-dependent DNA helicase RecG